jgi:Beta-lactamase
VIRLRGLSDGFWPGNFRRRRSLEGLRCTAWIPIRATPETVYELASATKPFTAIAVMLLVEDGKIDLDVRLAKLSVPANSRYP